MGGAIGTRAAANGLRGRVRRLVRNDNGSDPHRASIERIRGGSSEGFSFLGADLGATSIARVRITSGDQFLAPGNTALDSVVLDDFI